MTINKGLTMLTEITPGLEYISFQKDKLFGVELEGIVESLRDQSSKKMTEKDLTPITDCIEKHTNLKVKRSLIHGFEAAMENTPLMGYSGTDSLNLNVMKNPMVHKFAQDRFKSSKKPFYVDLKNAKVGGNIDWIESRIHLGTDLFQKDSEFTTEEVTSIILHEVGHAFNRLSTVCDLVWLNYALTEGVEVLRGESKRRVEFKIATNDELAKRASGTEQAKAIKEGTAEPEALREVLIDQFAEHRRQHLGSSIGGGHRDEQMADWFAARMGYGRALATGLAKMGPHISARRYRSPGVWTLMELTKGLSLVLGIGLMFIPGLGMTGFCWITTYFGLEMGHDFNDTMSTYGNHTQRLKRLYNDAVNRLKQRSLPEPLRQEAYDDAKVIGLLLKDMNERSTVFEALMYMANRSYRRKIQKLDQESVLEELLNNDLFVDAHTATQLTK